MSPSCPFEPFAGGTTDEDQTQIDRPFTQAANDALAMEGVARGRPGIVRDQTLFEHAVEQDGELASRGRDRVGLAHAVGQAAIKGPSTTLVRPRVMAARRRMPAARLAEGCVLAVRSRPAEILFWGPSVRLRRAAAEDGAGGLNEEPAGV